MPERSADDSSRKKYVIKRYGLAQYWHSQQGRRGGVAVGEGCSVDLQTARKRKIEGLPICPPANNWEAKETRFPRPRNPIPCHDIPAHIQILSQMTIISVVFIVMQNLDIRLKFAGRVVQLDVIGTI